MRAPRAGYLSVNPPDGGWGEYFRTPDITPVQPVTFTDEARRFETGGTGNYPGMVGLTASLRIINQLGPAAIETHIRALTDALLDGLDRLPVRVITPRDPACRSGIVTFGLGNVAEEAALIEHLLDQRIMVSHRYTSGVGGVRVSCHFFNSTADVARLIEETARWLRRGQIQP
jgi:selenocysteine lyase/cysteine desulfurase